MVLVKQPNDGGKKIADASPADNRREPKSAIFIWGRTTIHMPLAGFPQRATGAQVYV